MPTHKGLRFGIWLAWTQGGDDPDPTRPGAVMCVARSGDDVMVSAGLPCFVEDDELSRRHGLSRRAQGGGLVFARGAPCGSASTKVDLLEHDQDMVTSACDRLDHRHTVSPVDVAYHGLARLLPASRTGCGQPFPELLLENCCHGGRTGSTMASFVARTT